MSCAKIYSACSRERSVSVSYENIPKCFCNSISVGFVGAQRQTTSASLRGLCSSVLHFSTARSKSKNTNSVVRDEKKHGSPSPFSPFAVRRGRRRPDERPRSWRPSLAQHAAEPQTHAPGHAAEDGGWSGKRFSSPQKQIVHDHLLL